jgi:hypothetical protein
MTMMNHKGAAMPRRVPYGVANYAELVRDNSYFVDKTPYIAKLEQVKNPVYLRPRRFGKSLLCTMLWYYYDLNYRDNFAELFGHTWIGQHPTGQQNKYIVLNLDFSSMAIGPTYEAMANSFQAQVNTNLEILTMLYPAHLGDMPTIHPDAPLVDNLERLLTYLSNPQLPQLYVIIDEYDNFANQLITGNQDHLYHQLTADQSFFKAFFKSLKEGRKTGAIANIFITGVLPVTMDELASAFNIANFLTLRPEFEAMLGFTQAEVDQLLAEVYQDYPIDPTTRTEVAATIKDHYNGYHFANLTGEALYNSTILMYFLDSFIVQGEIPEQLIDPNLKTDISWVRRLTASNPLLTEAFVQQLTLENTISYDARFLREKFDMYQFFEPGYFPISFFYLGMLTRQDRFFMRLPNLNMRQIFVEYFNQIHHIDVSTQYIAMTQAFINEPNLESLFAGYWREYITQLPEAVFARMNENFYRTTFYELCSRYLSPWFTWNVERSYPSGKSDLEFVGKYHEKFAGLRWVIEFKYYSNAEFAKLKTTIEAFHLQAEDTLQIAGYVEGLRQEYPEARIQQYVIYCIGNQGFRLFTVIG